MINQASLPKQQFTDQEKKAWGYKQIVRAWQQEKTKGKIIKSQRRMIEVYFYDRDGLKNNEIAQKLDTQIRQVQRLRNEYKKLCSQDISIYDIGIVLEWFSNGKNIRNTEFLDDIKSPAQKAYANHLFLKLNPHTNKTVKNTQKYNDSQNNNFNYITSHILRNDTPAEKYEIYPCGNWYCKLINWVELEFAIDRCCEDREIPKEEYENDFWYKVLCAND